MESSETSKLRVWIYLTAVIAAALLIKSASSDPTAATQNTPATTGQAPGAPSGAVALSKPVLVGRLAQPGLTESSGLVASLKYPGVYWSMNDSGNPPMLYAVDSVGKGLCRIRLTGAKNIDWEDIAADDEMLYIGDVGDNLCKRKVLTIYAVGEPDPKGKTETAPVKCEYRFRYPAGHGPFDCEAMFVRKGWAYLITKETPRARLYRVRLDGVSTPVEKTLQAEDLGPLPNAHWVTAADISPDGMKIAVLSYLGVWVYQLDLPIEKVAVEATLKPSAETETQTSATRQAPTTRPVQVVSVKPLNRSIMLRQAEAICWEAGRCPEALLITNEQREVYRISLIGQDKAKKIRKTGSGDFSRRKKKRARQCLLKALSPPFALVEVPSHYEAL